MKGKDKCVLQAECKTCKMMNHKREGEGKKGYGG